MKYHRAPYHKKKHGGADWKEKKADPSRFAHASIPAAERSPSPRVHTGDHFPTTAQHAGNPAGSGVTITSMPLAIQA